MTEQDYQTGRMACPKCRRTFTCAGTPDCWCLRVERKFDYMDFIAETGIASCVCPVCLTGKESDRAEAAGGR